jgi:hypothetical protein
MAHGAEGVVLSQRKYVLDILSERDILRCKLTVSSINVKAKMSANV